MNDAAVIYFPGESRFGGEASFLTCLEGGGGDESLKATLIGGGG